MKRITILTTFVALLCSVQTALAWGNVGHRTVATIAEKHLTPETKAIVNKYLDGEPLAKNAATWMDRKGIMLVEISQSQKTTDFMILSTTPCHLPRALVIYLCVCKSLSRFQLFVTPSTVARQAPLSMGFSGQESWSGLPFPSLGVIYLYKDSILLLQLLTFNPP